MDRLDVQLMNHLSDLKAALIVPKIWEFIPEMVWLSGGCSENNDVLTLWRYRIPKEMRNASQWLIMMACSMAQRGHDKRAVGAALIMGEECSIVQHTCDGIAAGRQDFNVAVKDHWRMFSGLALGDGALLINNDGYLIQFWARLELPQKPRESNGAGSSRHRAVQTFTQRVASAIGVCISEGSGVVTIYQKGVIQWKSRPLFFSTQPWEELGS